MPPARVLAVPLFEAALTRRTQADDQGKLVETSTRILSIQQLENMRLLLLYDLKPSGANHCWVPASSENLTRTPCDLPAYTWTQP
jgi:hypothetical protein